VVNATPQPLYPQKDPVPTVQEAGWVSEILKNEDLIIEIQRMWNVKTKVILVTTGATGTISKSLG
jgi:hypothetical protein